MKEPDLEKIYPHIPPGTELSEEEAMNLIRDGVRKVFMSRVVGMLEKIFPKSQDISEYYEPDGVVRHFGTTIGTLTPQQIAEVLFVSTTNPETLMVVVAEIEQYVVLVTTLQRASAVAQKAKQVFQNYSLESEIKDAIGRAVKEQTTAFVKDAIGSKLAEMTKSYSNLHEAMFALLEAVSQRATPEKTTAALVRKVSALDEIIVNALREQLRNISYTNARQNDAAMMTIRLVDQYKAFRDRLDRESGGRKY